MTRLAAFALALAACSGPPTCAGAAPATALVEGYCPNGDADRCYFHPKPMDGF